MGLLQDSMTSLIQTNTSGKFHATYYLMAIAFQKNG